MARKRFGLEEAHVRMVAAEEPAAALAGAAGLRPLPPLFAQQELGEALGEGKLPDPLGTMQEQCMGELVEHPAQALPGRRMKL